MQATFTTKAASKTYVTANLESALRYLEHHGRRLQETANMLEDGLLALSNGLAACYSDEVTVSVKNGATMTQLVPTVFSDTINGFGLHWFDTSAGKRLALAIRMEKWSTLRFVDGERAGDVEDILVWEWQPLISLPGETVAPERAVLRARLWVVDNAEGLLASLCDEALRIDRQAEIAAALLAGIVVREAPPFGTAFPRSQCFTFMPRQIVPIEPRD